jgi:hypothetical protein
MKKTKYRKIENGKLYHIECYSFKFLDFIKSIHNDKANYYFKLKLYKMPKFYTTIDKYWSDEYMKWVDGYIFLGINFIRLTLYLEKTKYKIKFNLPKKWNFHTIKPIIWNNGEFENFLESIRM